MTPKPKAVQTQESISSGDRPIKTWNRHTPAKDEGLFDVLIGSWSINHVLAKLCDAADILLHDKNYDGHGYEEIIICVRRGREMLTALADFNPTAPADEGEQRKDDKLKAELAEHYSLACTGAPDCKCSMCMYEAGKNIGNIITEKRAGKIIANLQAALAEKDTEIKVLDKIIINRKDVIAEKDKQIANLMETEGGYANAHDDLVEIQEELEAKLKSTEAAVGAVREDIDRVLAAAVDALNKLDEAAHDKEKNDR